MKPKPFEILFLAVCLAAAAAAVTAVYLSRYRSNESEVYISSEQNVEDNYDVSVINSATRDDFMSVSGIGEVKADDIIAYRTALGGFSRVGQLKDIRGISDALYQRIIDYFYGEKASEPEASEVTQPQVTSPPETSAPETSAPETSAPETSAPETSALPKKTESKKETTTEPTEAAEEEETETIERTMRSVAINSASADEIADALMIDIKLAEEIVSLRETIHGFSAVQELDLCGGMTDEIYRRIKGFVIID